MRKPRERIGDVLLSVHLYLISDSILLFEKGGVWLRKGITKKSFKYFDHLKSSHSCDIQNSSDF